MSNRWSIISGIFTIAAFVVAVIFFVATQELTSRDWFVAILGALVGGSLVGFVFTLFSRAVDQSQTRETDNAIATKRLEMIAALPSRTQAIRALQDEITQNEIDETSAEGSSQAAAFAAREADAYGMPGDAATARAVARTWNIKKEALIARGNDLAADLNQLQALSDDEYRARQKATRGL